MMPNRRSSAPPVEETESIAETMEKLPAYTQFLNQRLENIKTRYEAMENEWLRLTALERKRRWHGVWQAAGVLFADCKALARNRGLYTDLTTKMDQRMKAVDETVPRRDYNRSRAKLRAFIEEITVFLEKARILLSIFPPEQDIGEIIWANAIAEARFRLARLAAKKQAVSGASK